MATREEVYEAIDTEREYQRKWDTARPEYRTIHFDWRFVDWCNYQCSYCCAHDFMVQKFSKDTSKSGGKHDVAAFILFMEQYLQEAREIEAKAASEDVREEVLSKIRCVVALGVACMEQYGAPKRC